jgi:hypothetical protein
LIKLFREQPTEEISDSLLEDEADIALLTLALFPEGYPPKVQQNAEPQTCEPPSKEASHDVEDTFEDLFSLMRKQRKHTPSSSKEFVPSWTSGKQLDTATSPEEYSKSLEAEMDAYFRSP